MPRVASHLGSGRPGPGNGCRAGNRLTNQRPGPCLEAQPQDHGRGPGPGASELGNAEAQKPVGGCYRLRGCRTVWSVNQSGPSACPQVAGQNVELAVRIATCISGLVLCWFERSTDRAVPGRHGECESRLLWQSEVSFARPLAATPTTRPGRPSAVTGVGWGSCPGR